MNFALPPSGQKYVSYAVTGALLLVALAGGRALIAYYQSDPWTRDGRIRADIVQVAPDVAGSVTQVYVTHDQPVHKGEALFQIDPARFDLAIGQAAAQVAAAQADAAKAAFAATRANASLAEARREAHRNEGLGDLVAAEATQQSQTRVNEAEAMRAEAHADGAAAQAKLAGARNALGLARLNRARTCVKAPMDGVLSDLNLRVGNYVTTGVPALALIDTRSLRVEGYFEETKLPRIHVGQAAVIHLMGEDKPLTGHVFSIAAAIEDHDRVDSPHMLPAINPTFSWVRLAQRVPVRIRLDNPPLHIALVAGRTGTVTLSEDGK